MAADFESRVAVVRPLNRGGVSAAPLVELPLVSIFDDDEYENYDFDVIPPRRRLKIASLLAEAGYRQTSGRTIESADGSLRLAFPKPGILGSDPSRPVDELLNQADAMTMVTPTQALLLYLRHLPSCPLAELIDELRGLVWEQPANLDKVGDWARAAGQGSRFAAFRPELAQAQAEGIELRRERRFESRLPR